MGGDATTGGTGHLIQGKLIGTDATGAAAVAQFQTGVSFAYAVTNSTLGGTTPAARNVISGNGARGVLVSNSIGAANIAGKRLFRRRRAGRRAYQSVEDQRSQGDFAHVGDAIPRPADEPS